MAGDVFLKVDQIPGESTDGQYKDWIEVNSYGFDIAQSVTRQSGGGFGHTIGKAEFGDLAISKDVDKASPKLSLASSNGTSIKEVILAICRAGGDKMKFYEIKLSGCIVTNYRFDGAGGGIPHEDITFNYGRMEWTYIQQRRSDGGGGGQVAAGWDLDANKKI